MLPQDPKRYGAETQIYRFDIKTDSTKKTATKFFVWKTEWQSGTKFILLSYSAQI